jgi:Ran GTPase-activating protein (RanGAP) involved in mRNA processing and transport
LSFINLLEFEIIMKIQLFVGGKREKVTKEKAKEVVDRWNRQLEGKDGVFRVDISCLSWTQEAFDVIQPFLEKIAPDVKYGAFADIIAGLMTDEGLSVTEGLARTFAKAPLVDIDLSDNAMGPRGLSRIESMIVNAPLQRLYLSNCGLSSESMELLHTWFTADNNRIASGMKELVVDRNMLGTDGAKVMGDIIGHCPKLQWFSYLGCRTQKGTIYLANGLKTMVHGTKRHPLSRLELDDCNFGEEENPAYVPLAEALEECSQMRHLDLTDTKVEIEGLTKVLDALTTAGAQLSHLGLGEYLCTAQEFDTGKSLSNGKRN